MAEDQQLTRAERRAQAQAAVQAGQQAQQAEQIEELNEVADAQSQEEATQAPAEQIAEDGAAQTAEGTDEVVQEQAPADESAQEQQDETHDEEVIHELPLPTGEQQGQEEKAPEVPSAAPAVPEPAPEAPAPAVVEEKPAEAPVQAAQIGTAYGPATTIAIHRLNRYVAEMDPKKPISEAAGVRLQGDLYRTITTIINHTGDEFNAAFTYLLETIAANRGGVFHDDLVFRFTEHLLLSKEQRVAFLKLVDLLKLTADPKGRALALKQVRLLDALTTDITEEGRQKVCAFYGH